MNAPTRTRPTISAVIITLNEAARLPHLLTRLNWVDEIVVVDGGSTDATVEIARQHGCRVLLHPFDHFAAQRNRALRAASSEWVLSIDADELPTPELVNEIWQAICRPHISGYRIPIRSRIFGHRFRYSGTQDDCPLRLARRCSAIWTGAVHELLHVHGETGHLAHALQHETIPDLPTFFAKVERYTTLAAETRVASDMPPRARDLFIAPVRELFRRLIWKRGLLDGPHGWAFCALSGWSEWVLTRKHHKLWRQRTTRQWALAG